MTQQNSIGVADVMAAALETGLFISLCTITELPEADASYSDSGAALRSAYVAISGLEDIRCMAAPETFGDGMKADEAKSEAETLTMRPLHVLLESYFPTITTANRAVIDDLDYDILGVESDSQKQMTRINVRQATI